MKDLPITLLVMDCFTAPKTLAAVDFSTRWCHFNEVVFMTDTKKFPDLKLPPFNTDVHQSFPGQLREMTVIHHEQSDRKVTRPGAPQHKPLPIDYELAIMREPGRHVQTSHYLHLEWDSAVLNPYAWNDEWLKYDYIGAPWPPHYEHGFPPCDGRTNAVGNAGASLQSVRYARAVRKMTEEFKSDPNLISSDMYPCRTARGWLEENFGIKFAPVPVAWAFSCENRVYGGQFCFHGRWTVQMNGWRGPFFDPMYP